MYNLYDICVLFKSLVLCGVVPRLYMQVSRAEVTTSMPWPVVVTIQSTVSFVFLAAIFYITIHFQLNFMFWGMSKYCL